VVSNLNTLSTPTEKRA